MQVNLNNHKEKSMNFSKLHLSEENQPNPALEASKTSGEKSLKGGERQINNTNDRKDRQKAQMATQSSVPQKSDVSFASEEARRTREEVQMLESSKSDWRTELVEAAQPDEEGNHPYVDIMPNMNQKAMDMKKKMASNKMAGGKQAKMAEEMSIKDQMAMAAEAGKKRNPNPDHKAIRGKMLKLKPPAKDPRTDVQKMSDATGPRKGSNFRGD